MPQKDHIFYFEEEEDEKNTQIFHRKKKIVKKLEHELELFTKIYNKKLPLLI